MFRSATERAKTDPKPTLLEILQILTDRRSPEEAKRIPGTSSHRSPDSHLARHLPNPPEALPALSDTHRVLPAAQVVHFGCGSTIEPFGGIAPEYAALLPGYECCDDIEPFGGTAPEYAALLPGYECCDDIEPFGGIVPEYAALLPGYARSEAQMRITAYERVCEGSVHGGLLPKEVPF